MSTMIGVVAFLDSVLIILPISSVSDLIVSPIGIRLIMKVLIAMIVYSMTFVEIAALVAIATASFPLVYGPSEVLRLHFNIAVVEFVVSVTSPRRPRSFILPGHLPAVVLVTIFIFDIVFVSISTSLMSITLVSLLFSGP